MRDMLMDRRSCPFYETVQNKNLAIANRSRISCAHNMSRASMITQWPWNLG